MHLRDFARRKRIAVFSAVLVFVALAAALFWYAQKPVLRIRDVSSGRIYVEAPVRAGDELFFGWLHSLERIPWNEWYTVERDGTLTLQTMSFPAFGAGIPCDKGTPRIENGIIFYEQIGQSFPQLKWLNSTFTKDIVLNGTFLASGDTLPNHEILTLTIERRGLHVGN